MENQRWRLLAAAGEVLATNGYARTRSADIARRAGVSRSTFYEQFEDVDDCLQVAYEVAADCIVDLLSGACEGSSDRDESLRRAVPAVLEFLAADPTMVNLIGSEAAAGVPGIARAREGLVDRLAEMLRAVRAAGRPGANDQPESEIERSLVGGGLTLMAGGGRVVRVGLLRIRHRGRGRASARPRPRASCTAGASFSTGVTG